MEKLKNQKYVEDLWKCYQKGIKKEGLEEKELFLRLVDDAINQVIEAAEKGVRK